jgi:DNA-directed RNA polymerase
MSTLKDKHAAQLLLEEEMGSMGVSRYFKTLEKQGQASTMVGQRLLESILQDYIQAIEGFCESTRSGKARTLASTAKYLEMIGIKEVAYISLRRVINGLSGRDRLVAISESIATLLEDELNYRAFRKEAPALMHVIMSRLEGTAANARHKRTVIMGAKTRIAGIEKVSLPTDIRIKVGLKLVELVESLGIIERMKKTEGKNRTVIYVVPTDKMSKWLEDQNNHCSLLSPVYLPMVVKPKPWTDPFNGGYLETRLTMMKTRNKAYLEELANVDMPLVYAGINAIQDTGWKINKAVYGVMKTLWETTGGGVAKLPEKEGKPIPQKPLDIDTNEVARKEWIGRAAAVHNENFKSRSKVIATSQKLWVAEKFLEEEEFFFPHVLDWRGRAYAVPGFVNPQSDDSGKALLMFSQGKRLGSEGAAWLAIHLANTFGYDKVDFDERINWAQQRTELILDSALKPLDGERFWLHADKPFQFLAACFEWLGYTMQGEDYVSHIAVALDGSCNGLQNFSAMLRDERGGRATNLVPSSKPSDIYAEVAAVVQKMIDEDAEAGVYEAIKWKQALYNEEGKWVTKPIGRKLTKRNTMTRPYSVTSHGMRDQVMAEIDGMLNAGEIMFPGEEVKVSDLAYYLADKNLTAISTVVVAAEEAMKWLQDVAKVVSSNGLPVIWTTPVGLPVRQFYTVQHAEVLRVWLDGKETNVQYNRHGTELNTRKQSAGISPNFVHGCDAAHMMRTIGLCLDNGITSYSMIHDSYGVHACDTGTLARNLREAFVIQYSEDVLGRFLREITEQLTSSGAVDLVAKLPPLPAFGNLDLSVVLDSEYFFA